MSYHINEEFLEPRIDGILYDDMWGLSREQRRALSARGVAWETEFTMEGDAFAHCGCVVAASLEQAILIADARGLGEKVIGRWYEAEDPWFEEGE